VPGVGWAFSGSCRTRFSIHDDLIFESRIARCIMGKPRGLCQTIYVGFRLRIGQPPLRSRQVFLSYWYCHRTATLFCWTRVSPRIFGR
jgi:hypothetical protein